MCKMISLTLPTNYNEMRQKVVPPLRCFVLLLAWLVTASSCDRGTFRTFISKVCSPDKEKPVPYHEAQGYSPGEWKSRIEEDFNRYHYYIAPEPDLILNSDPEIYFRQDYSSPEPDMGFDEEKYWQEHPLELENYPPGMEAELEEVLKR